jgi:hypothetical protein
VVAPAAAILAEGGLLVLDGTIPVLGKDGVTMTAGAYRPTEVCDGGIAEKLGIPAGYLRKMRASRPGLFDANVNGWLAGDDRSFFVRCLRGVDGGDGGGARVAVGRLQADRPPRHAHGRIRRHPHRRAGREHRLLRPDRAAHVRPGPVRGGARAGPGAAGRLPVAIHRGGRGGQPGGVRRVCGGQLRDRLRRGYRHPATGGAGVASCPPARTRSRPCAISTGSHTPCPPTP